MLEKFLICSLGVTSLTFAWLYFSASRKLAGSASKIRAMEKSFNDLHDLVWDHGKFMDSKGKADEQYKSEEVAEHWTTFHKLTRNFWRL